MQHKFLKPLLHIGFAVLIAVVIFIAVNILVGNSNGGGSAASFQAGTAGAVESNPGVAPGTIAKIVDSAGPAVVKISTIRVSRFEEPSISDPFGYFFNQPLPPQAREQQGVGSGFIISADGLIITNEHVVSGADEIKITMLGQEKEYPATIIGADYDLDLALLKVKGAKNLPYLKLADSELVAVGNWAIAIGNPFGFDHTVTVGVISAKGRPITVEGRQYKNLLQTDAAINPGNSGGPLLNLQGEVIGINTAVANAQGIGFAIPSNTVKEVLNELKTKGNVATPWLGVQMTDLTKDLASYFGLQANGGVVVMGVIPGSPADKAGLQQMDILLEINGKKIKDSKDLTESIKNMSVGQKTSLLVFRNGQLLNVTFTVGKKPDGLR